jgi:hypothetical protein
MELLNISDEESRKNMGFYDDDVEILVRFSLCWMCWMYWLCWLCCLCRLLVVLDVLFEGCLSCL